MNYKLGLIALLSLCACSIDDPDPDPTTEPRHGHGGADQSRRGVAAIQRAPHPRARRFGRGCAGPLRAAVRPARSDQRDHARCAELRHRELRAVPLVRRPELRPGGRAVPHRTDEPGDRFRGDLAGRPDRRVRTTYILDLLWRDASGRLVAIQLRALLGNATGPTQVWWRLPGNDDDDPIARDVGTLSDPAAPTVITAPDGTTNPKLSGMFVRALPVYGDIGAITIDDTIQSGTVVNGTYNAAYPYCLPWCFGEDGELELNLANVATGTGRLALIPAGNPTQAHDYVVYAIWRAFDGTASAIQLQRVDGVAPSGPLFTMYRQWWTGVSAAAAPANPATCATWLGLAQYYQIRALQCGMGACWALSPLYASWAQYYQGLANAAGCDVSP